MTMFASGARCSETVADCCAMFPQRDVMNRRTCKHPGWILWGEESLPLVQACPRSLTYIAPEKWMVGRRAFPFGARPIFRGENAVSFREGNYYNFCLRVLKGYIPSWDPSSPYPPTVWVHGTLLSRMDFPNFPRWDMDSFPGGYNLSDAIPWFQCTVG